MNTKLLLILSLAVNLALADGLIVLSAKLSVLPDSTPPAFQFKFITNNPSPAQTTPDAKSP